VRENTDKWLELCKEASTEQDPEKLMKLTAGILRLLEEKDKRLRDHYSVYLPVRFELRTEKTGPAFDALGIVV